MKCFCVLCVLESVLAHVANMLIFSNGYFASREQVSGDGVQGQVQRRVVAVLQQQAGSGRVPHRRLWAHWPVDAVSLKFKYVLLYLEIIGGVISVVGRGEGGAWDQCIRVRYCFVCKTAAYMMKICEWRNCSNTDCVLFASRAAGSFPQRCHPYRGNMLASGHFRRRLCRM